MDLVARGAGHILRVVRAARPVHALAAFMATETGTIAVGHRCAGVFAEQAEEAIHLLISRDAGLHAIQAIRLGSFLGIRGLVDVLVAFAMAAGAGGRVETMGWMILNIEQLDCEQYNCHTPAMGIAGRYYTDGSMAGGFERMIQITNQLIEQERKRT